ncbi:MAG: hypothetical protein P4L90_25780 [Rhodopila sp.]|nr:hypothetical protein [Rhodopila sp.]
MRVLNRVDFLKMPAGTIYARGIPWAFDGLSIKAESLGSDWVCMNPCWVSAHDSGQAFDRLEEMLDTGKSYPAEDAFGRDGCFDADAIFLVFERADLEALQSHIAAALEVA